MKKRLWVIFLTLLMAVSLFGCAKQETVYEADVNGVVLQVDIEQKKISDGQYTYGYEFSGDGSSYRVTITYPNGSSYWWNESEFSGSGGWSDDYAEGTYVSGDTLVRAVTVVEEVDNTEQRNVGKVLAGLLLIAFGAFELLAPDALWYLRHGWRFKNAQPSDAVLTVSRIIGGIAILTGIVVMLFY